MTVQSAADAAAEAFRVYGRTSGQQRGRLLRRIADGIEALGERLVECVTRETALPDVRVTSERARTCAQLRLFASVAEQDAWLDDRVDPEDTGRQPRKPRIHSRLRPLGPVAVFGASNFPLAFSVAGGDTAAALAVGCPVIVKSHPAHPETCRMVSEVIHSVVTAEGLPVGTFALVASSSVDRERDVGRHLVEHPLIKAAAFTGSSSGGMALWRAVQNRSEPIPFFAEMSSVNPVFLFPGIVSTQAESIARGLHASMTVGVGQLCTQPGLIFLVDDAVGQRFVKTLAAEVQQTPPGTMLTRAMRSAYQRAVAARVQSIGVRELAAVACGNDTEVGAVLLSVDSQVFLKRPHLTEEIFGPASLVVLCRTVEEFDICVESLPGQLTGTVWATPDELDRQGDFMWLLEQKVGRIVFNGPSGKTKETKPK